MNVAAAREWAVKRGILYFLTQLPMIGFLIGVAFKWTTFPVATVFTVLLGFILLPMWIAYRKDRSDDPEEPVHHIAKYALWALIPYVVYNIARIPMYYIVGVVFWDHWSAYGAVLTGELPDRWVSLLSGIVVHSLQGYVLVLGYYILFSRRTLKSALLYVWVFLALIYSTLFPLFILIDFRPGPYWHFVVWWAHFWMAVAAWYVPRIYKPQPWKRLRSPISKAAAIILVVILYLSPVLFVLWRAGTWQFPLQAEIDADLFDRTSLVLAKDPVLVNVADIGQGRGQQAYYRFSLRFGPRDYKDFVNATKLIDAAPISVTGRLLSGTKPIAFCFSYTEALPSPAFVKRPAQYMPLLRTMIFVNIPVDCVGPPEEGERLDLTSSLTQLDVYWTAVAFLAGDREKTQQNFGGADFRDVVSGTWEPTVPRPDPGRERRPTF